MGRGKTREERERLTIAYEEAPMRAAGEVLLVRRGEPKLYQVAHRRDTVPDVEQPRLSEQRLDVLLAKSDAAGIVGLCNRV